MSSLLRRSPDTGLVMIPDGFLNVHRVEIVSLAANYRLPAVYPWRFFTELGGLMSYGFDQREFFSTAAAYINRVLKGEKPADSPCRHLPSTSLSLTAEPQKLSG